MNIIKILLTLTLLLLIVSCKDGNTAKVDMSHVSINVELKRFDQDFHNATAESFSDVVNEYPYLFPGNEPDSIWLLRKNDSLAQVLFKEVQRIFGDLALEKNKFKDILKRVKYHYPTFKEPKIITLVSNLSMEDQIIYADSLLLISLDTYLGYASPFYANYPDYLKSSFDKKQLPVHFAKAFAKEIQPKQPYRVFMERMVSAGKIQYAIHEFLPDEAESSRLNYTDKQLAWAQENEEQIWKYFIEKEYLFSTDKELKLRFLDPAPFSKFYRTTDNDSPGRIGEWLGYQIVKSYMQNYVVSLPELMGTTPEEIFKKSHYKPKR